MPPFFLVVLNQPIKLRHRARLDGIHDIDVGLHGLVVGVAGPFHHDIRGDAQGQDVDDEGAAAGVGADQFPFGLNLVGADVTLVGGDADLLIDTGEFAQLFDVAVHRLVGLFIFTSVSAAIATCICRLFRVHFIFREAERIIAITYLCLAVLSTYPLLVISAFATMTFSPDASNWLIIRNVLSVLAMDLSVFWLAVLSARLLVKIRERYS